MSTERETKMRKVIKEYDTFILDYDDISENLSYTVDL